MAEQQLPHNRQDCLAFRHDKNGGINGSSNDEGNANAKFCHLCYCFVCDEPASECNNWYRGAKGVVCRSVEGGEGNAKTAGEDDADGKPEVDEDGKPKADEEDVAKPLDLIIRSSDRRPYRNHCDATDKGDLKGVWKSMRKAAREREGRDPFQATKRETPPFTKWECDVCRFAQFDTYEEAEAHERRCQISTVRLTHQEGKQHGLLMREAYGKAKIVLIRDSVLFELVKHIRKDATAFFLPKTMNCNGFDQWEDVDDEELDTIIGVARKHLPSVRIPSGYGGTSASDTINDDSLKAALRGKIRPWDTVITINSETADLRSKMGSSKVSASKLYGVLRDPEIYPCELTLCRQTSNRSTPTTKKSLRRETKVLKLNCNMFVRNGDLGRLSLGLSKLQKLEELHLENNKIGLEGCEALANLLTRKDSMLCHLSLRDNRIDDGCMIVFANALENNGTLKVLDVSGNRSISSLGWALLLDLVCDPTSIERTYASNHALGYLGEMGIGDSLREMLEINRHVNAARAKTWKTHFNRKDFGLRELLDIDVLLMPRVLAWFTTNKSLASWGNLFRLIRNRNIPELFGNPSVESVRIGSRVAELESLVQALRVKVETLEAENNALKAGADLTGSPKRKRRAF